MSSADRHTARVRGRRQAWALVLVGTCAACASAPSASPTTSSASNPTPPPTTAPAVVPTAAPNTTPPTTAAPTTAPATTTLPATDADTACVTGWPLRDRIALLVWPAVYSDRWAQAAHVVSDLHVGGVVLMRPGDAFAADLGGHLDELTALSAHGLAVATDEEGGAVQRLAAIDTIPSQAELSTRSSAEIAAVISQHAQLVAAAGVDVILGPVVDVRPISGDDPLGQGRLFHGDPQQVAALATEYVHAWQSAGLLPVLKHYPGHGSASTDTHQSLATTAALDQLLVRDLIPYEMLAKSGAAVMIGHLDVPGLTDGLPASASAAAVALLRDDLGWGDALVMTDALDMGAVGLPVADAAVQALRAGIDVVIFTSTDDTEGVIMAVERAVSTGVLTEDAIDDSATRVARVLARNAEPCAPA